MLVDNLLINILSDDKVGKEDPQIEKDEETAVGKEDRKYNIKVEKVPAEKATCDSK